MLGIGLTAASASNRSARSAYSRPHRWGGTATTTASTTIPPAAITTTTTVATVKPNTPAPPVTTTSTPSTPAVAPAPAPAPAPANPYLFDDEFNGTALDTTKWYVSNSCANFTDTNSCPSTANVSVGGGNLVAQISRAGSGYRGALLATVNYENGYAPYAARGWAKAEWPVPYTITMRALMPNTPGAWPALWARSDDGSQELDYAEQQMTFPTAAGCHQHQWSDGDDQRPFNGGVTVSNMATNWHTYSAVVTASSVTYKVDGATCGVAYGEPTGSRHAVIIDNLLGAPGSWAAGGRAPAASDPGPWNLLVDYVRVSRV